MNDVASLVFFVHDPSMSPGFDEWGSNRNRGPYQRKVNKCHCLFLAMHHQFQKGLCPRLRKNFFFSKTKHLGFFEKNVFFWVFQNETEFCSFLKENRKSPFWIVFIPSCISRFSKSHNDNLYVLMAFKIEGKEMYPIFVFAMCCWSVHSKW